VLHVALAALVIGWSGTGHGPARKAVPVVVALPPGGRVPNRPVELQSYLGRKAVVSDYSVTPRDAITFSSTDPLGLAGYAPDAYALPSKRYHGPATIQARYQNETASIPAFVYDSLAVSCYFMFPDGLTFDSGGNAVASGTPAESDIFQAGPENVPQMDAFRGCAGAFIDRAQTTFPLHVPYGGTLIAAQNYIGDVSVKQWRNDFSIVPQTHAGDILLFKTRDGHVVKALVYPASGNAFSAAYVSAPPKHEFADYAYYHPSRKR